MLSLRLSIIYVLSATLAISFVKAEEPIVTLDYGSFQGRTSSGVVEFLGIPFAAPPWVQCNPSVKYSYLPSGLEIFDSLPLNHRSNLTEFGKPRPTGLLVRRVVLVTSQVCLLEAPLETYRTFREDFLRCLPYNLRIVRAHIIHPCTLISSF